MDTPETRLNAMLDRFENEHHRAGRNLRALIGDTPELRSRVLKAIEAGNLDDFAVLGSDLRKRGSLGAYRADNETIALPEDLLRKAGRREDTANSLRMFIGHEIEHAVHKKEILESQKAFSDQVDAVRHGPSPHDYTDVLRQNNADRRARESNDQIAGFNVLAAHVRRENPQATQEQMYEKLFKSSNQMEQYFDVDRSSGREVYTPKPGLSIGADGKVATTPDNLEAFGKYFYDRNHYPQQYAFDALEYIYSKERAAQGPNGMLGFGMPKPSIDAKVDLKALGLEGLPLPPGFKDSSPVQRQDAAPEHAPQRAPASHTAPPQASEPRDPQHRDHGYFQFLRERLPAQVPDDAVADAMLQAKRTGLHEPSQVDPRQVGVGADGKVWIGDHVPGFHVGADPAAAPPMAQTAQALDAVAPPTPAQAPSAPAQTQEAPHHGARSL